MGKNMTPIQAIRKKCLECSNGQYNEIRACMIDTCPLYSFRVGENYSKKEECTSEQISIESMGHE
ncbi:MAG TPA: hypothetical protein DEF04_05400 [Clostridiales bacterium]|nr:hypothetical protein [Clostridiales bacterium]